MVQLVSDSPVGDPLLTPVGLREVSTYAQGIGPSRDRLLPVDERGRVVAGRRTGGGGAPRRARRLLLDAAGRERLPPAGAAPRRRTRPARATPSAQARLLLDLGVDGLITDSPEHAVRARRGPASGAALVY